MAHTLTIGQRSALTMTPLLLRLALALTFIWAGVTKVFGTMDVTDQNRGALVAAGVLSSAAAATPAEPAHEDPAPDGSPPADTTRADPQPEPTPEPTPEPEPTPPTELEPDPQPDPADPPIIEPAPLPEDPPADPVPAEPAPVDPDPATPQSPPSTPRPSSNPPDTAADAPGVRAVLVSQPAAASDVRALHGLSLAIHAAANPAPTEAEAGAAAEPAMPLLPAGLGAPPWPVRLAWAAALAELVGGILLLGGFATRLSALAIAGVMAMAAWMTQIGPAIQAGDAVLGFLPGGEGYDPWDLRTYSTFLWQIALLAASLGLVFSGGGGLSLDAWMFGRSGSPGDDD
ncbi:MAG: DoxX family membrane protein [Planctomycetota bacterium]